MEYEAVIGLEIHAQLKTKSKIFSSSSTKFGSPPNSQVNPLCLGMPGVLPVLNTKALELAVKAALATNCEIQLTSRFARKNYFYPDLPKGYQISQYEEPFSVNGFLDVEVEGKTKRIRIKRIHLEEDAGKLIHDDSPVDSFLDLNRAGTPLIEIVTEPDIRSSEEAVSYVRQIRSIMRYIEVCDGNMEQGSMRCDANISVKQKGSDKLGTKTEIKNLNSFRFIQKAIDYEAKRQAELIENREYIIQETRLFDPEKGKTFSMRTKEDAHDYRYFPDPDLPPVVLEESWVESLRKSLPELPDHRLKRFLSDYELSLNDAKLLTSSKGLADYFERCLESFDKPKELSHWIVTEMLREIDSEGNIDEYPVTPEMLAELLNLIQDGTINRKIAKEIFPEMIAEKKRAKDLIKQEGIRQMSDTSEIEVFVQKVLDDNHKEVERYRSGDNKLIGFFVGQVMKLTKGKANPKLVNDAIRKLIQDDD